MFLLQMDASIRGLGAVLTVVQYGAEIPVAFYSIRLLSAETRYSATKLEGLAVVAAVEHFSYYLVCHPFKIQTDHRALSFLNTTKHLNGRLAGWALHLQHYSFNIVYRPRKDNVMSGPGLTSRLLPNDSKLTHIHELFMLITL